MMPPRKPQGPPPPPPPTRSSSFEPIKTNTKVANVNQTENNSFSPGPKSTKSKNPLIIIAIVLLALASVAGAFFLLRERQDIRKGATSTVTSPADVILVAVPVMTIVPADKLVASPMVIVEAANLVMIPEQKNITKLVEMSNVSK